MKNRFKLFLTLSLLFVAHLTELNASDRGASAAEAAVAGVVNDLAAVDRSFDIEQIENDEGAARLELSRSSYLSASDFVMNPSGKISEGVKRRLRAEQKLQEIEKRKSVAQLREQLDKATRIVEQQIEKVLAAIERRNMQSPDDSLLDSALGGSSFVVTGGHDFDEIMTTLERKFAQFPIPVNSELRQHACDLIDQQIAKIEDVNGSLAHVQTLIVDNAADSLFDKIAENNDLAKVGINMHQLYEFIGLNPQNRIELTPQTVITHYDNVFIKSCDDEKKMKARQVRFILGNTVGKRIYDAWLSDYSDYIKSQRTGSTWQENLGHLAMMKISPDEAQQYGIDCESIAQNSNKLIACLINLRDLKKRFSH